MQKKYFFICLSVIVLLVVIFLVFVLSKPTNIDREIAFAGKHTIVGPLLLISLRILGIIFPALPAGVISFAVVPIFGWMQTYIYTLTGILIGTSIAFFLARTFREKLVQRFLPLKKIYKLEEEMSKKKEFLAIVALRLFTAPVMDFSSYIAGLTKISYKKFMLATVVASIPDIFIFYVGEEAYKKIFGKSLFVAVVILLTVASVYYIFKKIIVLKKINKPKQ